MPGIRIDAQRVVVLPINVYPPGNLHDRGSGVRLARQAGRLIFGRVPGVRHFAPFGVQRNKLKIIFVRHHHPVAPQFGDDRYPVAREILRGRRPRRFRRQLLGRQPGLVESVPRGERHSISEQYCRAYQYPRPLATEFFSRTFPFSSLAHPACVSILLAGETLVRRLDEHIRRPVAVTLAVNRIEVLRSAGPP